MDRVHDYAYWIGRIRNLKEALEQAEKYKWRLVSIKGLGPDSPEIRDFNIKMTRMRHTLEICRHKAAEALICE